MNKCVNVVLIPIEVDPQIWMFRVGNQPFGIVERYVYSRTARYMWYIVEPGKRPLTDAMLLIRYDGRHCLIKTSWKYSVAINGVLHAASEWVTIRDGDTVQVGNWRKDEKLILNATFSYGTEQKNNLVHTAIPERQQKVSHGQVKNTIPVKPVKVCNANRTIRKGIVCTTYEELLNLCCVKFDYKSVNTVVLDEDGTEIDAQYFYLLQENCNLMVLQPRESWTVNDLIGHSSCQAMRNSIDTEKWHPRLLQMPKLEIGLDKNMEFLQFSDTHQQHTRPLQPEENQSVNKHSFKTSSSNIFRHKSTTSEVQSMICTICYDREKNAVIIPCGHSTCSVCAEQVFKTFNKECPVCRRSIQKINPLFLN